MKALFLEPYYGGSHRAFVEGWTKSSSHEWTVMGLPPYKWKWRMRHSAITFADNVAQSLSQGKAWDVVVASDMLNLAEFKGLAPEKVSGIPVVAYFHENQLTYPVTEERERDMHFAFTNLTTALAADAIWFNTGFHRDEYISALDRFVRRMPDNRPAGVVDLIVEKSCVMPQGFYPVPFSEEQSSSGPLRILWAARWEHDKNPDDFFSALYQLVVGGIDFRLAVIGESFSDVPESFARAEKDFAGHIDYWGFRKSRSEYEEVLRWADVVVSTARHEFFGVGVVEAISAGAYPLLPCRLAYPEILGVNSGEPDGFLYDGSVNGLCGRLVELAGTKESLAKKARALAVDVEAHFAWANLVPRLDSALESHAGLL